MPHFGLMGTEESFRTPEGALLRARLHIRAGRRRLRQGKLSAGLLTLYDALLFAMEWQVLSPERRALLRTLAGEDLKDDHTLYRVLVRSGILDGRFDYEAFDALIGAAAAEELKEYRYDDLVSGYEAVMMQLGVMPFNEDDLPPEDPATF